MRTAHLLPCSVLGDTLSPPLLLRSHSSPVPSTCSCSSSVHGQLRLEVIPEQLLTSEPSKFLEAIDTLAWVISEHLNRSSQSTSSVFLSRNSSNFRNIKNNWWEELFYPEERETSLTLSQFAHVWRALVYFHKLFSTSRGDPRCIAEGSIKSVNICKPRRDSESDRKCACNGLQIRFGSSTLIDAYDSSIWFPCSRDLAMGIVTSWAQLTMQDAEEIPIDSTGSGDKNSNLAPQSFGVVQNWVDFMTMGKLGPGASSKIQVEPEIPALPNQVSSPEPCIGAPSKELVVLKQTDPDDLASKTTLDTIKPITLIIRWTESNQEAEHHSLLKSKQWAKLSQAWTKAVHDRFNDGSGTNGKSLLIDLTQPWDDHNWHQIVSKICDIWQQQCCCF